MTERRNQTIHALDGENISDYSKEQDQFLPIANVSRLMKKALPPNAKISKDAKETVQECVSEFISFITGEASDKCQREKRKTINGDDLLWAMTTLGFENYVGPLKAYLNTYRETEGDRSLSARQEDSSPTHSDHFLNSERSTAGYLPVKSDFHRTDNGGFQTLGLQLTPEVGSGNTGYKGDLSTDAFALNRVLREDVHANSTLQAQFQFGIEW